MADGASDNEAILQRILGEILLEEVSNYILKKTSQSSYFLQSFSLAETWLVKNLGQEATSKTKALLEIW